MYQPCEDRFEQLSLHADGLLIQPELRALEAHLVICEGCRQTLADWRRISASIQALPDALPPADLRDRILATTTRQKSRIGWLWRLRPAMLFAPSAAAVVLGIWLAASTLSGTVETANVPFSNEPAVRSTSGASSQPVTARSASQPILTSSETYAAPVKQQAELRTAEVQTQWVPNMRVSAVRDATTEERIRPPSTMISLTDTTDSPVSYLPDFETANARPPRNDPAMGTVVSLPPVEKTSPTEDRWAKIREQLHADNEEWKGEWRKRNGRERRLNVPIITVKF